MLTTQVKLKNLNTTNLYLTSYSRSFRCPLPRCVCFGALAAAHHASLSAGLEIGWMSKTRDRQASYTSCLCSKPQRTHLLIFSWRMCRASMARNPTVFFLRCAQCLTYDRMRAVCLPYPDKLHSMVMSACRRFQ